MQPHLLIFGLGYSATYIRARFIARGWRVTGVRRAPQDDASVLAFADQAGTAQALSSATHILSSVPPDAEGRDPVLDHFGSTITQAPARWIGYLSSTGVYGDSGGAWVDESSPVGTGRRSARTEADKGWQTLRPDVRVFRLPGIYGPGRSALDRVREGRAHRLDLPGQIFSRIHVDDIAGAVEASLSGPPGIYNIADDHPCSQNAVIEHACALLGLPLPPLQTPEEAQLSPMAMGFYKENRRISAHKAQRLLGWCPIFPTYYSGLAACLAAETTQKRER